MIIFPAIDILDGQCVRLRQGDFASAKTYFTCPFSALTQIEKTGAHWVHIVDLDGAKDGRSRQYGLIEKMARQTSLKIQVGGGIRTTEDIEYFLSCGAVRVVIGSLAVTNPSLVAEWINLYGSEQVVAAFDIRTTSDGRACLATQGWRTTSEISFQELVSQYTDGGLTYCLCTDIDRDGILCGPNLPLYRQLGSSFPNLKIMASGGISSTCDLNELKTLNLYGAIVGKAYYEAKIDLRQVIDKEKDVKCSPNA